MAFACAAANLNRCEYNSIESVRRLGKKGEKVRPIVITLLTMGLKIQIQKNKKNFENTPYYIKEDFPLEVLNKRKELQVQLEKEREQGRMAIIKYDKLIVLNNRSPRVEQKQTNNQKRNLSESPEITENSTNKYQQNKKQPMKINKTNSMKNFVVKKPSFIYPENKKAENIRWEVNDNIESYYSKIESTIQQSLNILTSREAKKDIISDETKQLIKARTELQHRPAKNNDDKKELSTLYKTTNKLLKRDYESYRINIIEKNLLNFGSQKRAYKQLNTEKSWIPKLKSGKVSSKLQTRKDIVDVATEFYKNLYEDKSSTMQQQKYEKNILTCETDSTAAEPFLANNLLDGAIAKENNSSSKKVAY
ncbi:Endonuclease-reverse transcriptase [Operophtera brumata]|uniref:Endonuclease-reverse transcriptase n=1 Tax=Operophtera brumata TaxID=104452 RepID=A0A0L7L8E5_OPEBR|nr:Endonuclease-reverse transcriptase [Operophtera brumata]